MKTLANSEFHFTKAQDAVIPTKVDLFTFMKICDDVLGIKPKWEREGHIGILKYKLIHNAFVNSF